MVMNKLAYAMKLMKKTLLTVSKMIAIGDLFSNGDRDRDRNFRDRGHALLIGLKPRTNLKTIMMKATLIKYSVQKEKHKKD